nr:glycosyl hydrolase [uncultured Blautia sp.]
MGTLDKVKSMIKNPPKEYRSAPFWGWNDKLQKENLGEQIEGFKKAGMGGFFIHSREGLETEYLSTEWMEDVKFCVDKARENDLELWIYDEDKWPSGAAGGMVSRENPAEFTARALTMECGKAGELAVPTKLSTGEERIVTGNSDSLMCGENRSVDENSMSGRNAGEGSEMEETMGTEFLQGIYVIQTEADGRFIKRMKEYPAYEEAVGACGEEEEILILRQEISGKSEWYNGLMPPDNLNPESVKTFLKLTHEHYEEVFGGSFPKEVKGFFTDEPNCCDFFSVFHEGRPWIPWSIGFTEYFIEKRGYDPQEKLPYLFFDGEGAAKIRHDYWKTVAQRFEESYMKQVYEWCDARGLRTTGHILYENDLGYQTRVCGAAMPQLRYLHNPGIDLLGAQTDEYLTVKQCASVAHQYDRSMTISEAYGCTGWELDFSTQKWLGDWQFALGITRRCQHLALYSITGCRKRDYPPVFNYQNTWWEDNDKMENYFGRLALCLSQGEPVRKVLMIHPISSIWTECRSDRAEDFNHLEMNMGWLDEHITSLNRKGEYYNRIAKALTAGHVDFDFGDEILLEQDGKVENGLFVAGKCRYQVVVVPGVSNLFANTVKLLKEFLAAGGTVIWLKPYPVMIEGEKICGKYGDIRDILGEEAFVHTVEHEWELTEAVAECTGKDFTVRNASGAEDGEILSMLRETEDGNILFLTNHDRNNEHQVYIKLNCGDAVEELDPLTGEVCEVETVADGDGVCFTRTFATGTSRIYFVKKGASGEKVSGCGMTAATFPYRHPHYTDPVLATFGPDAKFRRTMENVLTIDRCTYELGENVGTMEKQTGSGENMISAQDIDAIVEQVSEFRHGSGLSEVGSVYESVKMEIWQAQREIREKLAMQQVYYNGAPQRYTWVDQPHPADGTPFAMHFRFNVLEEISGECSFVIEKPYGLEVYFDGEKCEETDEWFIDKDMRCFDLPSLSKGEHQITIKGSYDQKRELEDVFVTGNFAVDMCGNIFQEKEILHTGDWSMQGYVNYPGGMIYQYKVPRLISHKQVLLHLGEWSGTLLKVRVNGKEAGFHFEKKNCITDVTGLFENEENTLEIEISGSPRNMFGPFHQSYTGCSRISWADFRTEGMFHTDGKVLKPYGMMGQSYICEYEEQ